MSDTTPYYLGRVIKSGHLDSDKVVKAILDPKPVGWWGKSWSFFDAKLHNTNGIDYVVAKLSKFNPEGEVIIADIDKRQEVVQSEPNLRLASSNFIYIPNFSGVAFTQVYNHIDERQFAYRFSDTCLAD